MGPNPAEQNPPEKSMAQQAQEAADRAIAQIRSTYQTRFADIENIQDDGERIRARAQLAQDVKDSLREQIRQHLAAESEPGQADTPEAKKEKADNAKRILFEVKALGEKDVNVVDRKSQLLVDDLVENIKNGVLNDKDTLDIEKYLGTELINGVVFSGEKDQTSTTENNLKNLLQVNQKAASLVYQNVINNLGTYGTTAENLRQKIIGPNQENNSGSQNQRESRYSENQDINSEMIESGFQHAESYYLGRFTKDQMDIIQTFYSPTAFVEYLEDLSNRTPDGKKDPIKVLEEKNKIKEHIKRYYETNHKDFEPGDSLEKQVEKHWGEMVSEQMNWKVSDVINQLFLELQSKSPHKFYEEIMQSDPFYGPNAIQLRIQAALNALMTKVGQLEKDTNDPLHQRLEKLNLYRHAESQEKHIEERDGKTYPRLKPIPFGEKIKTSDFIKYVGMTIDHTIHKAEYFHNSRAIYGHPAGEKGFYNQLGGFAEMLKGTDIDEILMLPDGQQIMQAYQLYEKMLEEDFASLDWRHRPDQFQNQLERVNSKLEGEIIKQLMDFYPDLPETRITNIVNAAVGISRGVFLTESEKSAYADPVDSEGSGMVASYSTNDAASLNVFNPLHNALRWQGEHNWNMMYFMPVAGQPGMWDHSKAWGNMAKYMDSFIAGKGRGTGKDKLPVLFADAMMDINNVGGPNKRKGWRMSYSLDGHYIWDKDNTINAPETFKAMEAIGYEAIANFIDTDLMGKDLLKASESTDPGQAKERKDLFRYIFKKYFSDNPDKFQESELDNYLAKLRVQGEKNTLAKIKKNKGTTSNGEESIIDGSWDDQVTYETSKLFMKNAKAYYVAARMPSKFLRMDRNRFTEDGISRWERTFKEFEKEKGWDRAKFDLTMKDLNMTEMLLRRKISEKIREQISFDKNWKLNQIDEDFPSRLNEDIIRELLAKKSNGKDIFKSSKEIDDVVALWRHIRTDLGQNKFLDGDGAEKIDKYTFTFGLEDTDISLIPYRGTGPRMIARAIKDTGSIEENVTKWMLKMPDVLSEIAVSGKHDFTPIIEYLRVAKKAINDVHGSEGAQKFAYKIAGTVINYFKKDGMAKPLFGLFGIGKINSMAAEYAGRSTGVWEWDSRDIDRFCVALESYRILPLNAYDLNKTERGKKEGIYIGGKLEDRWIKLPFLKKPIRFGKKRHIDFEFNGAKLRKEHGADLKAITFDMINMLLPLAMAFVLWKYIKDAMDEAEGKKKQ